MLFVPIKQLLQVRQELSERIPCESSYEPQCCASNGILAIRNTFGSPGIREKIACGNSEEARIGRCEMTVRTARGDGHHSNLFDTARKSMILSPKVAGIFFPESAD